MKLLVLLQLNYGFANFFISPQNPGRPMQQHDAGGNLVHVLPAVPTAADEGFLNINFTHPQRDHALGKLTFLFETDGERAHGLMLLKCQGGWELFL